MDRNPCLCRQIHPMNVMIPHAGPRRLPPKKTYCSGLVLVRTEPCCLSTTLIQMRLRDFHQQGSKTYLNKYRYYLVLRAQVTRRLTKVKMCSTLGKKLAYCLRESTAMQTVLCWRGTTMRTLCRTDAVCQRTFLCVIPQTDAFKTAAAKRSGKIK